MRVQDDFFAHLNGKWLKEDRDPGRQVELGHLRQASTTTPRPQLRAIIENAATGQNQAAGTDAQRIGDFYASFMDEQKLEQLGLAP